MTDTQYAPSDESVRTDSPVEPVQTPTPSAPAFVESHPEYLGGLFLAVRLLADERATTAAGTGTIQGP